MRARLRQGDRRLVLKARRRQESLRPRQIWTGRGLMPLRKWGTFHEANAASADIVPRPSTSASVATSAKGDLHFMVAPPTPASSSFATSASVPLHFTCPKPEALF